jgi:1,4-alpha-glucan branching enzyme
MTREAARSSTNDRATRVTCEVSPGSAPRLPSSFVSSKTSQGSRTGSKCGSVSCTSLSAVLNSSRRREFAAFPEFADPEQRRSIPDPQSPSTFQASKLRWAERELPEHRQTLELYRTALALRRKDAVLARSGREQLLAQASGDVLIVQRWLNDDWRVLVMNLQNRKLPLARVWPGLRLRGARTLLNSEPQAGEDLPPGAAVVLAGSGNLADLVESKS